MKRLQAQVGENGQLIFPEEFNLRYGLKPGTRFMSMKQRKGRGSGCPLPI